MVRPGPPLRPAARATLDFLLLCLHNNRRQGRGRHMDSAPRWMVREIANTTVKQPCTVGPQTQQRPTGATTEPVASYEEVLTELVEAEHAEGWLTRCVERGVFLAVNDGLIAALHGVLSSMEAGRVVEVCAGDGTLAAALRNVGSAVIATDACPPPGAGEAVQTLAADEALRRLRPRVVIGSFVPADSGVNEQVLGDSGVGHYLLLTARLPGDGGVAGSPSGWKAEHLDHVARWMITRHDFHIDSSRPIVAHGEAWLLKRNKASS